jgi:hypothetical protein
MPCNTLQMPCKCRANAISKFKGPRVTLSLSLCSYHHCHHRNFQTTLEAAMMLMSMSEQYRGSVPANNTRQSYYSSPLLDRYCHHPKQQWRQSQWPSRKWWTDKPKWSNLRSLCNNHELRFSYSKKSSSKMKPCHRRLCNKWY